MSPSSFHGQTLGNYQIVGEIGRGGMATVYKGYQESIDRYVAIKILPPHPGQDQSFLERFHLEARTIASLQHPHILPLYDYGNENDIVYLVMAFISGGSLDDRIREQGPQSLQFTERVIRQIGGALDYAHRKGVIHRDVKPGNILMDGEGNALLADFGLVKLSEDTGTNLTGSAVVLGTPDYMSPEQVNGIMVTGSADIYAMGVVAYEMLTGTVPFKGDTPLKVALAHVNEPMPELADPNLPDGTDEVLRRALAKSPEERYPTNVAFADDLRRLLVGEAPALEVMGTREPVVSAQTTPITRMLGGTTTFSRAGSGEITLQTNSTTIVITLAVVAVVAVLGVTIAALLLRPTDDDLEPTVAPATEVAVMPQVPTFGRLSFSTESVIGDTVQLQVNGITTSAEVYGAWLRNTETGQTRLLGELNIGALGDGVLAYTADDAVTLPALYDTVIITAEESIGDEPAGDVVYSGGVPTALVNGLANILVASENGIGGDSLLASARAETAAALQHAGLAADASNVGGMHLHAEHTINIINGTEEDFNGDGRGQNPGRGVGVLPLLEWIEEEINTFTTDAPQSIQAQAELMRVCVVNARQRAERVIEFEQALLASDNVEASESDAGEASEVAEAIAAGLDFNDNGQVEPFEGECGLDQIDEFGVLVGNMTLVEGDVADVEEDTAS